MADKHQGHHPNRTEYVSEFTQFIDAYLQQHPEVVESQYQGWHIYWDRTTPIEELLKPDEYRVPVKGYDYF